MELSEPTAFHEFLAVKRFDRDAGGRRVHMEEFAQIFGYAPKAKYGKGLAYDFVQMVRVLHENALNRVIDKAMSSLTWEELEAMLKGAGVEDTKRLIVCAQKLVEQAQACWPDLLEAAPERMRHEVLRRLGGGVKLAKVIETV